MPRNVLVTGGGTGIGRAVAERFAAAGDSVTITGRRVDVLAKTAADLAGDVRPVVVDHADPGQVEAMMDALPERLDVLVNNAGGNTGFDYDEPTDLAGIALAWRRNLDANLISAVLTTYAVLPRIPDGGALVHIGSIAADKGAGAYGAAKAAVASWNVGLANDVGARGIRTNVVSPGYIAATEFFRDRLTDERRTALIHAQAIHRVGGPADIASTVFFLAGADAAHLTGQVLNVNGGEHKTR